ncbi:MAG: Sec-independent protein translocase protein TatB [Alphaproteobacteria bacterium MarineAlpha5_Bin9]|nr:MAG: Sec-independent protein translocase protein TatB [Alphaproteobacteria bacterium MarineAlpha5_Bin9]|tara:strand:- start:9667 stop:10014 length:348 start_codon:yes stop_codon:yes gene_type:complete
MFSFGWTELALVFVIVVIFIGPKELPNLLKHIGTFSKAIKKISREFKYSLNELSNEADIKDVKKSFDDLKTINKDLDPANSLKNEIKDIKDTTNIFKDEISKASSIDDKKNEDKK